MGDNTCVTLLPLCIVTSLHYCIFCDRYKCIRGLLIVLLLDLFIHPGEQLIGLFNTSFVRARILVPFCLL